jgi:hypothetical protein
MKSNLCSALAVAGLCFSSAAFSADPSMGQATDQAQPAPTLDVKQLPPAVQATLDREGGRVIKAQQDMGKGSKSYDVDVSKDGKNYSLLIDDNGSILKREAQ